MPNPRGIVKTFKSEWTLRYGLEFSTSNPSNKCAVLSLSSFGKMLNKSENGPQISNTSATHGEVTI